MNPIDRDVELFMQGTEYGDATTRERMAAELAARLAEARKSHRKLRVYCGFDPRTTDLHLGHTVPMRKMRQFQDAGHDVILVVGRFTSIIGDPSDQDRLRPRLSLKQATANAKSYAAQAYRVLDAKKKHVEYNDRWLSKISLEEWCRLAANFTIGQFLERDNFRDRFAKGDAIYVHELFYPIMQAYDAYHLKADVQIGGSDQLFNIVTAGRKLMEALGSRPNIGVILGILPGTDGVKKMSKSLGNHIPLRATARSMFEMIMRVPDGAMPAYRRLLTRWTPEEIGRIETDIQSKKGDPREANLDLAQEVVAIYHGAEAARRARASYTRMAKDGVPSGMRVWHLPRETNIVDVLVGAGLAPSRSQARRLIEQNAVKFEGSPVRSPDFRLGVSGTLQAGKRQGSFVRIAFGGEDPTVSP